MKRVKLNKKPIVSTSIVTCPYCETPQPIEVHWSKWVYDRPGRVTAHKLRIDYLTTLNASTHICKGELDDLHRLPKYETREV